MIDLLKSGAPSVLDAEGQTPLHLAAASGHLSLVEALLQAGCDVSVQDFVSLRPFLTIASSFPCSIIMLVRKAVAG